MEPKIKIMVTERNKLYSESMLHLLKENSHLEVIDQMSSDKELLGKLKNQLVDVVLLEVDPREINCYSTIAVLKSRFPTVKIIVHGEKVDNKFITDIKFKGINGFIGVNCGADKLCAAIESVYFKGHYFEPVNSDPILKELLSEKEESGSSEVQFNERELGVLKGICDGKSNREIAEILNLSYSTVDFYRSRIYSKTNCRNIASIIKYALQNGIVSYV